MSDLPCVSAVVTGASGGIGSAVARHLSAAGVKLLLLGRDSSHGKLADELGCDARLWDVTRSPDAGLVAAVNRLAGPIALVHCAGVLGPVGMRTTEAMLGDWWRTVEINLRGSTVACRLVLPRMVADRAGRVILMGGGGSCEARPRFSAYSVSKTAVLRLAECLALEYADSGVRVVCVAPGAVETSMLTACREAGDSPPRVLDVSECCRLIGRLLTEDVTGLSGRLVHVRDEWGVNQPAESSALWKLRRVTG